MTAVIPRDGTIGNSGDIQPNGVPAPGSVVVDPGIVTTTSAAASGGAAVVQNFSNGTTYAPLVITPIFGTSITSLTGTKADPTTAAQIEAAINAAINYYQVSWTSSVPAIINNGTITNTVSVAIQFDYGKVDTTTLVAGNGASTSSYGLTFIGGTGSYSAVQSLPSGVLPHLPNTDPTSGGSFIITTAQSQVLGLGGSGTAGSVGLNTVANGVTLDYNLADQSITGQIGAVGLVEHEISEVFGRFADLNAVNAPGFVTYSLLDLYRYSAPNTHALKAGPSDYFSLNNGTTALGFFNDAHTFGGDTGDWASSGTNNVPGDSFDAFLTTGTAGTVSSLDTAVLANIGLQPRPLPARTMVWTGSSSADFGTSTNWDDTTDNLTPASAVPSTIDTTFFSGGGALITGSGTAATMAFDGGGAWHVGSSAAIAALSGLIVGDSQAGALLINGGASASDGGAATIAPQLGAAGSSVDVSGAGSKLTVAGLLDVGMAGSGSLQLSGGATVTAGSLDAGNIAAAVGQIGLSGTGTSLNVAGNATVADDGTGVLSVLSGATFAAASLTIGNTGNSSGALLVSGSGSVINLSGALNIGTALGTGDLTVGPGAAVHASVVNLQGQVVLEGGLLDPTVNLIGQGKTAGGFGTISAGDIIDEGVIQAGGTKLLIVQGTVVGGGTLTVNGTLQGSNPAGILQINAGGTMELAGPVLNAATTTFTDNLTPAGTYTINNSVIDVTFADETGVLQLDSIAGFAGTISTYHAGDAFVITGGTLSNLGISNSNVLTFSDSGTNAGTGGTDSIVFGSTIDPATLSIVNGNTIVVGSPVDNTSAACFAAGTLIETEAGPVAVEALVVGDHVLTIEGTIEGTSEPIVWIGRRPVNCKQHLAPETVWPIRVRARAFGAGLPVRDLFLSPDHAVFVNGVLVPVKLLVNGTSIAQVRRTSVTYYHVELPRHAVILANGLPVESYLDLGDRMNFHQDGEAVRLFPDFTKRLAPDAARAWETRGAAPLVMAGGRLEQARRRLARRGKSGDRAMTGSPGRLGSTL